MRVARLRLTPRDDGDGGDDAAPATRGRDHWRPALASHFAGFVRGFNAKASAHEETRLIADGAALAAVRVEEVLSWEPDTLDVWALLAGDEEPPLAAFLVVHFHAGLPRFPLRRVMTRELRTELLGVALPGEPVTYYSSSFKLPETKPEHLLRLYTAALGRSPGLHLIWSFHAVLVDGLVRRGVVREQDVVWRGVHPVDGEPAHWIGFRPSGTWSFKL